MRYYQKIRKIYRFQFLNTWFWGHFERWMFFRWFSRDFLINIEENYMFYLWTFFENSTVNLFMCEYVDSGVKFKLMWLCVSNKNQIEFALNQVILNKKIENQKFIWSKYVFWCVTYDTQFDRRNCENIEYWRCGFGLKCLGNMVERWPNLLYKLSTTCLTEVKS